MANKEINPDTWEEYTQGEDGETIPNKERGCGYLKAGNAYIRCDTSAFSGDGVLPGFVAIVDSEGNLDPIPYKESLPRGYESLNGSNFLAAAETIRNFQPLYPGDADAEESHQEAHERAVENMVDVGVYPDADSVPSSELTRHLDRMAIDGIDGEHWGEMLPANAQDLMMRVGKSYYDHPWDYIDETLELGLNKGISVHSNKSPPVIQGGRTRCWLIHPHACGEDMPGVIGFAYLTRTIFTRDKDGNVPQYAQEYAESGKMDIVDIGEPEPREEDEDREGEDVAEAHRGLDTFEVEDEGRETGHEPAETATHDGGASIAEAAEEALEGASEDPAGSAPAHEPQQIEDLDKAELSELANENWIPAEHPPEEHDAVRGQGGLLGIVDGRKVTASNNFSFDPEEQHGSSVVGPYTVEVRLKNGERMILVEQ